MKYGLTPSSFSFRAVGSCLTPPDPFVSVHPPMKALLHTGSSLSAYGRAQAGGRCPYRQAISYQVFS